VFTKLEQKLVPETKKKMFLENTARPVLEAYNLTICEPIVETMWDPQRLTTL
jgi:hypothetical protein